VSLRVLLASIVLASMPACTLFAPHARNDATNPDERLAILMDRLATARAEGPNNDANRSEQTAFLDAGQVRSDLARFTLEYPNHVESLMVNALLAYEAGEPEGAAAYLDRVLHLDDAHARAAALRGRIALEQGNPAFARKLLQRHVDRAPDDAELREAYAAALFYDGDHDGAERELATAQRLGAPRWRVLYNRGLMAEKSGEVERAKRMYSSSVAENPASPATHRLAGL
jgi:tetratricopeptide (TPR) repeat protein